jgi:flagellin-like hook-associated protein FlgL
MDIYLGQGSGSFARAQSFVSSTVLSAAFGDLNGDGNLDIAVGASGGYGFLMGNGNGTFVNPVASVTGTSHTDVAVIDLDGDGLAEPVIISSSFLNVLTRTASGGYVNSGNYSGGSEFSLGDVDSDGVIDIVTGGGAGTGTAQVLLGNTRYGVGAILPFNLTTLADARAALPILSAKREQLAKQRGQLGAHLSRTAVAANVLDVARENFREAESRIRDADVATEAAALVRSQIVQKAAAAVLAQANKQPALAIRLLEAESG